MDIQAKPNLEWKSPEEMKAWRNRVIIFFITSVLATLTSVVPGATVYQWLAILAGWVMGIVGVVMIEWRLTVSDLRNGLIYGGFQLLVVIFSLTDERGYVGWWLILVAWICAVGVDWRFCQRSVNDTYDA